MKRKKTKNITTNHNKLYIHNTIHHHHLLSPFLILMNTENYFLFRNRDRVIDLTFFFFAAGNFL